MVVHIVKISIIESNVMAAIINAAARIELNIIFT